MLPLWSLLPGLFQSPLSWKGSIRQILQPGAQGGLWEPQLLSSSPCSTAPDTEMLTVEAALLILPAQSLWKSCVNPLNVEIEGNAAESLASCHFPFGL